MTVLSPSTWMSPRAVAWLMTVQHFEAAFGPARSKAAFDASVVAYGAMGHVERQAARQAFGIESPWLSVAWRQRVRALKARS